MGLGASSTNCATSTGIGLLFCKEGCNADNLRNMFTFLPPPRSYDVQFDVGQTTKGRMVYVMNELLQSDLHLKALADTEVSFVTTRHNSVVPVAWVRSQRTVDPHPLVLLHCHGNATDIGRMMGSYLELATKLGCDVVGVEYSGYGAATGSPGVANTFADLDAAYDFVSSCGVSPERIVAYGQSVGSGPVSGLASKPLGGLILHSALLSGIKVIDPYPDSCCRPSCVYKCLDFYPNYRHLRHAMCPVFVMHGQRDDVVPFYHGLRLHQACPKKQRWPPYFPHGAGHNDLVESDVRGYFGEVSNFLLEVKRRGNGKPAQIEMPQPVTTQMRSVVGSTDGRDARKCVELTDQSWRRPADDANVPEAFAEPIVGPEDGRYNRLRNPVGGPARDVELGGFS